MTAGAVTTNHRAAGTAFSAVKTMFMATGGIIQGVKSNACPHAGGDTGQRANIQAAKRKKRVLSTAFVRIEFWVTLPSLVFWNLCNKNAPANDMQPWRNK
jgi:hypothetical protein